MGYEYMGHTFWDQETWMYPALLMFRPTLGRSLLDYRVNRLQQAIQIAKNYGFKGEFPYQFKCLKIQQKNKQRTGS